MPNENFVAGLDKEVRLVGDDILFVFRLVVAFVLIVVGLIGLFLPIIPDWILIVFGIILLDTRGKMRRKLLSKVPKKYAKTVENFLFIIKVKNKKDKI